MMQRAQFPLRSISLNIPNDNRTRIDFPEPNFLCKAADFAHAGTNKTLMRQVEKKDWSTFLSGIMQIFTQHAKRVIRSIHFDSSELISLSNVYSALRMKLN